MGPDCRWTRGPELPTTSASTGDLHPPPRRPPSDGRLRLVHRSSVRACRAPQGPHRFLTFARYLRSLHPAEMRIAIVLDNFSPHLFTNNDRRVSVWADANNVELAYTPTYSSWLNRIEAQFQALRYFALDGTDHASHAEQASMIRRYIHRRNRHAHDHALREVINRANVA